MPMPGLGLHRYHSLLRRQAPAVAQRISSPRINREVSAQSRVHSPDRAAAAGNDPALGGSQASCPLGAVLLAPGNGVTLAADPLRANSRPRSMIRRTSGAVVAIGWRIGNRTPAAA
jgi:hypothetical protein